MWRFVAQICDIFLNLRSFLTLFSKSIYFSLAKHLLQQAFFKALRLGNLLGGAFYFGIDI